MKWPQDWKKTIFVDQPIFKRGGSRECTDRRTIALTGQYRTIALTGQYRTIALVCHAQVKYC